LAANNSLSLASLDFDGILTAQKAFMRSQSAFKDYDFDGSNINALLTVQSYNTFMLGFYLNMVAAERFNDSAQLRDSVVSHAKELNYTPRSATSAQTTLDISFPTSGITTLEIPKGTQFSGLNATGNHRFVTDRNSIYKSSNNFFRITDLPVFEGSYFTESYILDSSIENQQFLMNNKNIDINSVTVTVTDGSSTTEYKRATTLYSLGPDSPVFFIQASSNYLYELVFGDGIFGKRPVNGATITAQYRVTTGPDGNDIDTFLMNSDLGFQNGGLILSPVVITSSAKTDGGANAEDIESIRYMAPRHYQTQDRAITTIDYETVILEKFPNVKSIHVYGGEEVTGSVEYGRVFMAASTVTGNPLSLVDKESIKTYISDKNSLGIGPVLVDPDYIDLSLNINTHVDFRNSTLTLPMIQTLITAGVNFYNTTYLQRFNTAFRQSKFVAYLNSLDAAILSNEITVRISKTLSPPLNTSYAMSIKFLNRIKTGVSSTYFVSGGKEWSITDTITGVTNPGNSLYLLENNPSNITPNYSTIGTINYDNGLLDVAALNITSFLSSDGVTFTATPFNQDIYAKANDIIEVDFTKLNVDITSD
jgi:hypothetical protein